LDLADAAGFKNRLPPNERQKFLLQGLSVPDLRQMYRFTGWPDRRVSPVVVFHKMRYKASFLLRRFFNAVAWGGRRRSVKKIMDLNKFKALSYRYLMREFCYRIYYQADNYVDNHILFLIAHFLSRPK